MWFASKQPFVERSVAFRRIHLPGPAKIYPRPATRDPRPATRDPRSATRDPRRLDSHGDDGQNPNGDVIGDGEAIREILKDNL